MIVRLLPFGCIPLFPLLPPCGVPLLPAKRQLESGFVGFYSLVVSIFPIWKCLRLPIFGPVHPHLRVGLCAVFPLFCLFVCLSLVGNKFRGLLFALLSSLLQPRSHASLLLLQLPSAYTLSIRLVLHLYRLPLWAACNSWFICLFVSCNDRKKTWSRTATGVPSFRVPLAFHYPPTRKTGMTHGPSFVFVYCLTPVFVVRLLAFIHIDCLLSPASLACHHQPR